MDLDPLQIAILLGLGVLIFGKRLPEIAKKVAGSLAEIKRHVNTVRNEIEAAATGRPLPAKPLSYQISSDYEEATAPKFDPPPRPRRDAARPTPAFFDLSQEAS